MDLMGFHRTLDGFNGIQERILNGFNVVFYRNLNGFNGILWGLMELRSLLGYSR
jgi:hypothetical protein